MEDNNQKKANQILKSLFLNKYGELDNKNTPPMSINNIMQNNPKKALNIIKRFIKK